MSDIFEKAAIREFAAGDRRLVEDFFAQMGGETRAFFNRGDGNLKTAMEFFEGTASNKVYYLAELGGVMIGYVFLWDTNRGVPWLGIAVHDGYKGMGLGRRLIAHVIGYAKENGKGGLLLSTHIANIRGQGLYERMGFERIGMQDGGELLYILRFTDEMANGSTQS